MIKYGYNNYNQYRFENPCICRLEQSLEESVVSTLKEGCQRTVITVRRLLRDNETEQ